eukprot:TRINITY_DN25821_c0_g1_i1.p1 TRINITY_DN25821_c0_g1~~TRINITY_DN25821_c0_g1_i1.p1  ORF type:complete len:1267 (+),score=147.16 TRINITY_DN25821_c0_g1_i1:92-3892(+)
MVSLGAREKLLPAVVCWLWFCPGSAHRSPGSSPDAILDDANPRASLSTEKDVRVDNETNWSWFREDNWDEIVANVTKLSTLSYAEQLRAYHHWPHSLPEERRTAAVFKFLGQILLKSQGLTSAGQGWIAVLMSQIRRNAHLRFLKTEPGHYAFFHEVAKFSVRHFGRWGPGSVGLDRLFLMYLSVVSSENGILLKYHQIPFDTAEFWESRWRLDTADAKKTAWRRGLTKTAVVHTVAQRFRSFMKLQDAFDWYLNFTRSFQLQGLEEDLVTHVWPYSVRLAHGEQDASAAFLEMDGLYTKLPLHSFTALLSHIMGNSQQLPYRALQFLQKLVGMIESHSLETMRREEVDDLHKLADRTFKLSGVPSIPESYDIRNGSTAFALTLKLMISCKAVGERVDANDVATLSLHLLDAADRLEAQLQGAPTSILVSSVWRFFIMEGGNSNQLQLVVTRFFDVSRRVMERSTSGYLRKAFSGLVLNMCEETPELLMNGAPDLLLAKLNKLDTIIGTEEFTCIRSSAHFAPCHLLAMDPTLPEQLLEIMRGESNDDCVDTPHFQDAQGYDCDAWKDFAFSCKQQAILEKYTSEQAESISSNCKASCKSCMTRGLPKFSEHQGYLGTAFRDLASCNSTKSVFDELNVLRLICRDVTSYGAAALPVMEAVVDIIKRNPARYLRGNIVDELYELLSRTWSDALDPGHVRGLVLDAFRELVTTAGAMARDLETKNGELQTMTHAVKNKNDELHRSAVSLSKEKEVLRGISESQAEQLQRDERVRNLTRRFSSIAHRQVPCKEGLCIIPTGWMIKSVNNSYDLEKDDMDVFVSQNQLFRCPNTDACFGDRDWTTNSQKIDRMCAQGYSESSLGCAQCEDGYGRDQFDPFHCRKCASLNIASAHYVLPPLVIYAAGIAFANAEPTTAGSLMNVLLSFSLTASCVLTPLSSTRLYKELQANFSSFVIDLLELPQAGAESGGFGSMSYDCMQQQLSLSSHKAGEINFIWTWLAFDACVPGALLLSSLVINFGIRIFRPDMSLTRVLVLPMLVFGNSFIPKLFGSSLRSYPCIHEIHARQRVMAYALDVPCNMIKRVPIATACAMICCCLGPIFWAAMFRRSHTWTQACKKETLGYLSVDYQETYQWWETMVLIRKMSLAAVKTLWPASYAPSSYCLFCNIVVGTALMMHCWCCPYRSNFLNRVEIGALFSAFLAMAGAQYVTVDDEWTHTHFDSLALLLLTCFILTATFLILVGLWIYTLLTEMGLLKGFRAEPPKEPEVCE